MRTVLFVLVMLWCGFSHAAENYLLDFGLETESGLLSKHVYRGKLENEDPVGHTGLSLTWRQFGVAFFANTDVTDENAAKGKVGSAGLAFTIGDTLLKNNVDTLRQLDMTMGLRHRWYPEYKWDDRTEFFVQTGLKFVHEIEAVAEASVDFDTGSPYVEIDISRSFPVGKLNVKHYEFTTHLEPKVGLGWGGEGYNEEYHGVATAAFVEWHAGLELMFKSTKRPLELGPTVEYVSLMDSAIRAASDDDSHWVFGLKMTMRF